MATIALSAAGMALGGSIGGTVLGLSMATIGRAAGAAIGQRIDQQLLGGGSDVVEAGKIDRFRITSATEGADVQRIFGRARVAGQVIWASEFREHSSTSGGGKGTPSTPKTTTYSYSVSLALALCEGVVSRIGRVWADGTEISVGPLNMRLYAGTMDQLPDPKIIAIEGAENTPAYRGTAYVVLEDLQLEEFGNRIPQLTFEVMRPGSESELALNEGVRGVALLPSVGEYALATTQLHASPQVGQQTAVNTNTPFGGSDFTVAMGALEAELTECRSVVLPVSWFANDLRCADCFVKPKTTPDAIDPAQMPWQVNGLTRQAAESVTIMDDVPISGGTPSDASVIEAITDLNARGMDVVLYPQLLMEQVPGNTLINPWSGELGQPTLPWQGHLSASLAPTVSGSPDETGQVTAEVDDFMGEAQPTDFVINGTMVNYNGPADFRYRRFILHYATLCAAAGGVSAFMIGAEFVGLTQLRDDTGGSPFVDALRTLAADVRAILGPGCKISYAADWTEYHGFTPSGTEDKLFPLDPLWADENIDFVGISGGFPLADWRDEPDHRDAAAGSIYNLDYLTGNVAGGEGFDWTYPTPEAREAQRRVPIEDDSGEPWVWRPKDVLGWWSHAHHMRVGGVRQATSTAWVPESKPIWFTSVGCRAVEKGANEPGRFLNPASADAGLPYQSNGNRDDYMQMQYLAAFHQHFTDAANNPISAQYGAQMVDVDKIHVWGWDARPYPFWPGNQTVWQDGASYVDGLWLNGRASSRALSSVVREICEEAGLTSYDVSALHGVVRGYTVSNNGTAREALQPLMLAYGFDAVEQEGVIVFRNRDGEVDHVFDDASLARPPEEEYALSLTRDAGSEAVSHVQFGFINADSDYDPTSAEIIMPGEAHRLLTQSEAPIALTPQEGQAIAARWLQEARLGRDKARFALPPSQAEVRCGDTVALATTQHQGRYRIDRMEEAGLRLIEATRVEAEAYKAPPMRNEVVSLQPHVGPIPAELVFLDLPLLTGDELPHAPYIAAAGNPWPGSIGVYGAPQDSDYTLQEILNEAAVIGVTQTPLARGPVGIWDRQTGVEVELIDGAFSSALSDAILSGANTLAIGDGTIDNWEILQFRHAEPVYTRGFVLSHFLRGQAGTAGLMPEDWPAGSSVVLMNTVPTQITLPTASRGTTRHFRYGPAKQPITDPSYRYVSHAFAGNGLRPYPVAHLRATAAPGGVFVSWIRCSRIDGDIWADGDIPLGEDSEVYLVRVTQFGNIVREVTVTSASWAYESADMNSDLTAGPYDISVAQVSDRYGAGLFNTLSLTL